MKCKILSYKEEPTAAQENASYLDAVKVTQLEDSGPNANHHLVHNVNTLSKKGWPCAILPY